LAQKDKEKMLAETSALIWSSMSFEPTYISLGSGLASWPEKKEKKSTWRIWSIKYELL